MCGRFIQSYTWQEVYEFLNLFGEPQHLEPRYNIAPHQNGAVVRAEQQQRRLLPWSRMR